MVGKFDGPEMNNHGIAVLNVQGGCSTRDQHTTMYTAVKECMG